MVETTESRDALDAALQAIIEGARGSTGYCDWCGARPDQFHRGDCPAGIAHDALTEAGAASLRSTSRDSEVREAIEALRPLFETAGKPHDATCSLLDDSMWQGNNACSCGKEDAQKRLPSTAVNTVRAILDRPSASEERTR